MLIKVILLALALLIPAATDAGVALRGQAGGGGGNPFSLVAHVSGASSGGIAPTSPAKDMTGVKLIIINAFQFSGGSPPTPTDSSSNTYTQLTQQRVGNCINNLYYVISPTVTSSMTFTYTNASIFGGIEVAGFSRTGGAPTFDAETGNTAAGSGTTVTTGSLTPAASNELIVTGLCFGDDPGSATYTINSSFIITDTDPLVGSSNEGGGLAYLAQTTGAAVNPTWTDSTTYTMGATAAIAAFK